MTTFARVDRGRPPHRRQRNDTKKNRKRKPASQQHTAYRTHPKGRPAPTPTHQKSAIIHHHISTATHAHTKPMSSSDIASQLLRSSDSRIAEAAKRVFSTHPSSNRAVVRSLSMNYDAGTRAIGAAATAASPKDVEDAGESNVEEEEDRKLTSSERLKRR